MLWYHNETPYLRSIHAILLLFRCFCALSLSYSIFSTFFGGFVTVLFKEPSAQTQAFYLYALSHTHICVSEAINANRTAIQVFFLFGCLTFVLKLFSFVCLYFIHTNRYTSICMSVFIFSSYSLIVAVVVAGVLSSCVSKIQLCVFGVSLSLCIYISMQFLRRSQNISNGFEKRTLHGTSFKAIYCVLHICVFDLLSLFFCVCSLLSLVFLFFFLSLLAIISSMQTTQQNFDDDYLL